MTALSEAPTFRLTLPFPPKELNPNARGHWSKIGLVRSTYRTACGWLAKEAAAKATTPLTSPVRADTVFYVTDRRRRDMDNLQASLKPLWDGLVDAGVLTDDSWKDLRHGEPTLVVERGGEKRVEVTLTEVEV